MLFARSSRNSWTAVDASLREQVCGPHLHKAVRGALVHSTCDGDRYEDVNPGLPPVPAVAAAC
jgi:hypothetical protein